jgi:hypothetical protein
MIALPEAPACEQQEASWSRPAMVCAPVTPRVAAYKIETLMSVVSRADR